MKEWYKSSIVWLGTFIAFLAGALPAIIEVLNYIGEYDFEGGQVNWPMFIAGILIIIRRWYTDKAIETPKALSFLDSARPRIMEQTNEHDKDP